MLGRGGYLEKGVSFLGKEEIKEEKKGDSKRKTKLIKPSSAARMVV